jgi:crotonobetaine/carnitine-CoA ligase
MSDNKRPGWSRGQQDTINDAFRRAVQEHGSRDFLDDTRASYTYIQAHAQVCRLAHGLKALGVKKGDTVVTLLDNSADAAFIWLAINTLGAVSVPVNTAYKGEFLRHQVSDADAALVIAETDYAERVVEVADGLPTLRTLVYRGERAGTLAAFKGQALPWAEMVFEDTSDPVVEVKPGELAMLIYTGGTTGLSKGCMVSHNYACNMARQMLALTGRTKETRTWTPLPMFHFNAVASTVLCNILVGASVAIYPRFSVSNFWPEIERTRATDCQLLGTMVMLLARADDNEAMARCRGQLHAVWAAPFPEAVMQMWKERFGIRYAVTGGFGLTECAVVTHLPYGTPAKPGSSGKRCEWFDVRIVDDDDNELPDGSSGEIIVRPRVPHVMFEGYWKRPEDTLKLMRNQWFHTGDIGKFDEDGYFYFLDRKKDYLRRRGENISSMEVENALRTHPAVEDVAAHAVLSDLSEDELKLTIKLKAGAQLNEEELFHWCVDKLPYFAVARYIEFRAELPKNQVGRLLKYQLRDEGVTATTWDQERAGIKFRKR